MEAEINTHCSFHKWNFSCLGQKLHKIRKNVFSYCAILFDFLTLLHKICLRMFESTIFQLISVSWKSSIFWSTINLESFSQSFITNIMWANLCKSSKLNSFLWKTFSVFGLSQKKTFNFGWLCFCDRIFLSQNKPLPNVSWGKGKNSENCWNKTLKYFQIFIGSIQRK